MTISKYVHSCLIVRELGKTILIDPGNYSFDEKALDLGSLQALDYLLITHEHADHMSLPFIHSILKKFSDIQIISNEAVASLLKQEGITAKTAGDQYITLTPIPHERVFGMTMPQNTMFTLFGRLIHPGDSFQIKQTSDVLALPLQAPWGDLTQAVDSAVTLKPKFIIPIHDWHWNEKARQTFYQWLEKYFAEQGITFIPLATAEEFSC